MGLLKSFFNQCARPEGSLGRAMLCFMNYTHAPLTNWGLKLVNVQDGWTMLDVGCGGGFTIRRLLKRSKDAQVYGIDISEESVTKARQVNAEVLDKQVYVTQGSAEQLPYNDEMFDLVTAVETVYFWPNLPDCLQEVRRVLKPGGKFAIMVEVVDSDSAYRLISIHQAVFLVYLAQGAVGLHLTDDVVYQLQQVVLSLAHQHAYLAMRKGGIQ